MEILKNCKSIVKNLFLCLLGKRFVIEEKRDWKVGENKQSKIVFIGKNIQKEPLEKMLSQSFAKVPSN